MKCGLGISYFFRTLFQVHHLELESYFGIGLPKIKIRNEKNIFFNYDADYIVEDSLHYLILAFV